MILMIAYSFNKCAAFSEGHNSGLVLQKYMGHSMSEGPSNVD